MLLAAKNSQKSSKNVNTNEKLSKDYEFEKQNSNFTDNNKKRREKYDIERTSLSTDKNSYQAIVPKTKSKSRKGKSQESFIQVRLYLENFRLLNCLFFV